MDRHRERGSTALLRLMAFLSLRLGRTLSRIPLYGIAVYFFLFAPRRAPAFAPLSAARAGPAPERARSLSADPDFATTIHDRVYLINEQYDQFDITIEGEALMISQLEAAAAPCCWARTWGASR